MNRTLEDYFREKTMNKETLKTIKEKEQEMPKDDATLWIRASCCTSV